MSFWTRLYTVALALALGAHTTYAKNGAGAKKDIAKGTGVTVTLDGDREIKGVYLGRHDGAVWIGNDGGEIGLDAATVLKITPSATADGEFLRRKAALGPKDADGWWKLSEWAQRKQLTAYAQSAAETSVSINFDHAKARAYLGYEKYKGVWITLDEGKRARGLVEFEGAWLLPKEVDEITIRRRVEGKAEADRKSLEFQRVRNARAAAQTQDSSLSKIHGYIQTPPDPSRQ